MRILTSFIQAGERKDLAMDIEKNKDGANRRSVLKALLGTPLLFSAGTLSSSVLAQTPLTASGKLTVYFARHGESEANVLNVFSNRGVKHPLTNKGYQQGKTLAEALAKDKIEAIYSSPITRAIQTADIIALATNQVVRLAPEIREYDVGVYEDTGSEQGWKIFDEVQEAWNRGQPEAKMDGGESLSDQKGRFLPFMSRLLAQHGPTGGAIVLVAHSGIYRNMLPLVFDNIDMKFSMANKLANASYAKGELRDGRLHCVEWNGKAIS